MPSRRAVLAGVLGALGLGVGAGSQYRPGLDSWSPPPDTWPMARYGPANTAASLDSSLPEQPDIAWSVDPLNAVYRNGLLADRGRVYLAGAGVVALDRSDGTTRWERHGGGPAALEDGTLYVAPGEGLGSNREQMVRAFDARSGDHRWRASSVTEASSVLVADGSLFVGAESGLVELDDSDGERKWSNGAFYEAVPLVSDGRLYATDGRFSSDGSTVAFRARDFLTIASGRTPSVAWEREHGGRPLGAAASEGCLVAGYARASDSAVDGPAMTCYDSESGRTEWRIPGPDSDDEATVRGGPLAVADGRCVAGYSDGDGDAVVCRTLADGEELWHVTTDGHVTDIAVVGGGVVFGTENGIVRALDFHSGEDRWEVDIVVGVHALAPVDDAVFVASSGGQVFAIR